MLTIVIYNYNVFADFHYLDCNEQILMKVEAIHTATVKPSANSKDTPISVGETLGRFQFVIWFHLTFYSQI